MTTKKKSNFAGKVGANAQKKAQTGASYGHLRLPKGVGVFAPDPDGRYKLDFLPYVVTDPKHMDRDKELGVAMVGEVWWKKPYRLHRNVGSSDDAEVCLATIGKKCPICEYRAKRVKEGADKEELQSMNSSLRNLYIVIPLDSKKHEEKIHIFDMSDWNFQKLLTEELKEDDTKEIFPDLEEGLTVKVRFEAATVGKSKPFAEASRIDFLEREEGYDEAMLDKVPNLDEILHILSYDELAAKFFETEGEEEGGKVKEVEEEEEDEDEKPVRKHKVREEPEEEEEDDEPVRKKKRPVPVEEEDEEEDEKPVKKKKPAPVEEDEEEEDEKPTRKHSTPAKTSGKDKCPHGHKFGVDHEEYPECDDCKLWDLCLEEKEK